MTPSQNYRIHVSTIQALRKLEKEEKRTPSITSSLEYLIRFHKSVKKADPELYQRLRFNLN